ncbi:MAG: hypothetical protein IT537_08490 [Hyphomicrobiales bacterium]|nr:hypothetical protein [Hyphomicrobiales bacterium]
MTNVVSFPGNGRPIARDDEDAIVIILPMVRIEHRYEPPRVSSRRPRRLDRRLHPDPGPAA